MQSPDATNESRPDASVALRFVRSFSEVDRRATELVGGKGANLGELAAAGLPVPPGFVVTAPAYLAAMDAAGVRAELAQRGAAVGWLPSPVEC